MTVMEARVFNVDTRVAVDARTVQEDSMNFAGLRGTVVEVYDDDGEFDCSIKLDRIPEDEFSFRFEELCPAKGFMPGATDNQILDALLGKKLRWWNGGLRQEETDHVRATNKHSVYYTVVRNEINPLKDYVTFVGAYGFRAVYLSAIIGTVGGMKRRRSHK